MDGMTFIPSGAFSMGSDRFYPEEAPVRSVRVDNYWIDTVPVTNRAFSRFVEQTGYRTEAETAPDARDYPGMVVAMAHAGSLVFRKTAGPVDMEDVSQWWDFCFGADWRHPTGPDSSLNGLEDHPVVHITHADAEAYAHWAGKTLPTEAEWEFAARGGLEQADYAWGDELAPGGAMLANYWQGLFPFANQMLDGWERTSPVRSFPANGYGLYDMIGNVWEWTSNNFDAPPKQSRKTDRPCCSAAGTRRNAGGGSTGSGRSSEIEPVPRAPVIKVMKGGSYLCAPNYCQRYRPAARHAQPADTATGHVGFRCVRRGSSVLG